MPVYSSSSELKSVGLDSRGFRKIIFNALEKSNKELEEYYPKSIIKDQNLISYKEAIKEIHDPKDNNSLQKAIYRIKFDEHFFFQLLMALRKKKIKDTNGRSFNKKEKL